MTFLTQIGFIGGLQQKIKAIKHRNLKMLGTNWIIKQLFLKRNGKSTEMIV